MQRFGNWTLSTAENIAPYSEINRSATGSSEIEQMHAELMHMTGLENRTCSFFRKTFDEFGWAETNEVKETIAETEIINILIVMFHMVSFFPRWRG
jgi:hypothetical protein